MPADPPEEGRQLSAVEAAARYDGLLAVGDRQPERQHDTGNAVSDRQQTEAERRFNANVLGVTYRESKGHRHNRCIILCDQPNEQRVNRCPSCYGRAVPMDIYVSHLEPMPGRGARLAAWLGGLAGAFAEAVTFPFRVGRAHTAALVRDILQEAIGAGLSAEVDGLN